MYGGSVTEMYGGCLGRNMSAIGGSSYNPIKCDSYFYGIVNIKISGGTVSQTIYGAGAGGVSGLLLQAAFFRHEIQACFFHRLPGAPGYSDSG